MNLTELVSSYYAYRKYVDPNDFEAVAFTASELGEAAYEMAYLLLLRKVGLLSDAIVTDTGKKWVRNNPEDKHSNVKREIGGTMMMLTVLASKYGTDPVTEMIEYMKEKGWKEEGNETGAD